MKTVTGGTGSDTVEERAINVYGGKWLYRNPSRNAWSTLGNSASYKYGTSSREDGFVTCGHGWQVGDSVYYGSTYLGEVTHKWYGNGLDVSFIESSHNSTGRMLNASGPYVTHRDSVLSGETIHMYGANGLQDGTVEDTYIEGYWSSTEDVTVHHEGLFSMKDCLPISGDSGAAVLKKRSDGNYSMVGLVVGLYEDETLGAACPWDKIEEKCNIIPTV